MRATLRSNGGPGGRRGTWACEAKRGLSALSDHDLLARLTRVVAANRRVTAELIAHLAEVDRRRLYAREACSSMFVYCTERLGLSADATQKRIQVARASRRFPQLLEWLTAGRVHLSGLNLLASHLTEDNVEELLERAAGKSKREIEVLVAEIAPRPDVTSRIRKLPGSRSAARSTAANANAAASARCEENAPAEAEARAVPGDLFSASAPASVEGIAPVGSGSRRSITPLAPARYKVQFTAGQELHDKIERARELLSHRVPGGDLAELFDRVLAIAIPRLEHERFGLTDKPRAKVRATLSGSLGPTSSGTETTPQPPRRSRHISAEVKREVYQRDGGQCTYVDGHGRRCTARDMLEYDHIVPYALGGPATVDNTRIRCAVHNRLEAEEKFGAGFMAQKRLFG